MENKIEVIDDMIPEGFLQTLYDTCFETRFKWQISNSSTVPDDNNASAACTVFTHNTVIDNICFYLQPLFEFLKVERLLRVKYNCYFSRENHNEWPFHVDIEDIPSDVNGKWKTAVVYLHDNNGYTEFRDGKKIESVAGRIAVFDGELEHRTVTQTDTPTRIVINLNYIEKNDEQESI